MTITAQQANEAREHLISFARNNQIIDAAVAAIKKYYADDDSEFSSANDAAEAAINDAVSQPPWGSWDDYLGNTNEWLSTDLHDANGDVVDDPMDAVDQDEQWDRISERHMSDLLEIANRVARE